MGIVWYTDTFLFVPYKYALQHWWKIMLLFYHSIAKELAKHKRNNCYMYLVCYLPLQEQTQWLRSPVMIVLVKRLESSASILLLTTPAAVNLSTGKY